MLFKDILEEHAEEAAFLFVLRQGATTAPHYNLADLEELDARIEAHLDGLRIAGDTGWEVAQQVLGGTDAGEIFVLAHIAFDTGVDAYVQAVMGKSGDDPQLVTGVASAMAWLPGDVVKPYLDRFLAEERSGPKQVALAAAAMQGYDPGPVLTAAMSDDDALVRARAHAVVGELGRRDLTPQLRRAYDDMDDDVCFWANWSGALLGDVTATRNLKALVLADKCKKTALEIVLRCTPAAEARAISDEVNATVIDQRDRIWGLGVIGDPYAANEILEAMSDSAYARIAGEAMATMTGVDIAGEGLEQVNSPAEYARTNREGDEEDTLHDPDADLPYPDPVRLAQWWQSHKSRFSPGTRYLNGRPIDLANVGDCLVNSSQRIRRAAALERMALQSGQPLFQTTARAIWQRQSLSDL